MTQMAIQTDGLSRFFGPVRAVDGLSMYVPPRQHLGFWDQWLRQDDHDPLPV